jgi:glycosyl transferase family 25
LGKLGLNFERVSAVDGLGLNLQEHVHPWLSWLYMGFNMDFKGHVGCFLSHRKVWKAMADKGIPHALILEDDATFIDWNKGICDIRIADYGLDLLRIGVNSKKSKIKNQFTAKLVEPSHLTILDRRISLESTPGACGYILNLGGARKLLRKAKYWFPVDHFALWRSYYGVVSGLTLPPMICPAKFVSDTATEKRIEGLRAKFVKKNRRAFYVFGNRCSALRSLMSW